MVVIFKMQRRSTVDFPMKERSWMLIIEQTVPQWSLGLSEFGLGLDRSKKRKISGKINEAILGCMRDLNS